MFTISSALLNHPQTERDPALTRKECTAQKLAHPTE